MVGIVFNAAGMVRVFGYTDRGFIFICKKSGGELTSQADGAMSRLPFSWFSSVRLKVTLLLFIDHANHI